MARVGLAQQRSSFRYYFCGISILDSGWVYITRVMAPSCSGFSNRNFDINMSRITCCSMLQTVNSSKLDTGPSSPVGPATAPHLPARFALPKAVSLSLLAPITPKHQNNLLRRAYRPANIRERALLVFNSTPSMLPTCFTRHGLCSPPPRRTPIPG